LFRLAAAIESSISLFPIIRRGAVVRREIIDANVLVDADDDIGYSPERDHRRFHALANGA
jgi:ADP-glucose pyrophosphorylase